MDAAPNKPTRASRSGTPAYPDPRAAGGLVHDDAPAPAALRVQRLLLGKPWRTLGVLMLAVAAGVLVQTVRHTAVYESQATIQILPYKSDSPGLAPDRRFGQNYERFMNTQVALLRSRPILRRALEENLKQDVRFERRVEHWSVQRMIEQVQIAQPPRTHLLNVKSAHADADLAQAVVDATVHAYLDSLEQGIVDSDVHRLRQAEQQLHALNEQRDQLQNQMVQARLDLSEKLDRLEQLQREAEAVAADVSAPDSAADRDPRLRRCLAALAEAKLERDQMSRRFSERHPAMRRLAQRISLLEQTLQTMRRQAASSTTRRTTTAQASAPTASADAIQAIRAEVAGAELAWTQLSHRMSTIRQAIDQAAAHVDQLKRESGVAGQLDLVEPPNRPTIPITDKLRKSLMLGGVGGGAFGFFVLIVFCAMDRRCHFADQLPELGDGSMLGELPATSDHDAGAAVDAIHRVRMCLQAGGFGAEDKIALVTSSETGGGATTFCIGLGASLARCGRRTLLIDADVERRWLSRCFGSAVERDFEAVLRADGRVSPRDIDAIVKELDADESKLRRMLHDLGHRVDRGEPIDNAHRLRHRNQMLYEQVVDSGLLPLLEAQRLIQSCRNQPRGLFEALEGVELHHCIARTQLSGLNLLPIHDDPSHRYDTLGAESMCRLLQSVGADYDAVLIDAPALDRSLAALLMRSQIDRSLLVVPRGGSMQRVREALDLLGADAVAPGMLFNHHGRADSGRSFDPRVQALLRNVAAPAPAMQQKPVRLAA